LENPPSVLYRRADFPVRFFVFFTERGGLTGEIDGGMIPPMSIAKADQKRRVVLPGARPGDVFEVREDGADAYRLVRLRPPEPAARLTRGQVAARLRSDPLRPKLFALRLVALHHHGRA